MSGVWEATAKAIRNENARLLSSAKQSLAALQNQDGWYAEDHRKVIALREDIAAVIETHINAGAAA